MRFHNNFPSLHNSDSTGSAIDNLCQHFQTVKTKPDFPLSVSLMSLSSLIITDKMDGLTQISILITFKAQTVSVFRTWQPNGASRLTHVGEGSLARGGVERASGRRQLRGAVALCHADYGVGVAPAGSTAFTLWQAWAIASGEREVVLMKLQHSMRFEMNAWRAVVLTYSKPFFGKVFLSVCKL